jgi:hypothetical protein
MVNYSGDIQEIYMLGTTSNKELISVKQAIKIIESRMSKDIMGRVDVICATCIGACDEILEEFKFPVVLIDGNVPWALLLM